MIEVKDLYFSYEKRGSSALNGVSFSINRGEIYSLLGPNGAGKTTLIRIIAGLILPQSGSVTIDGRDCGKIWGAARRTIGLVLGDERTFYFRLTGAQNLELFGGLGGVSRQQLKLRVGEVLEQTGLNHAKDLHYMRYSSGMKKRLSFARALLLQPKVFLLDEPNSGVDPQSAKTIRDLIYELRRGGAPILLTTHDMSEAEKLSDRIGFIKEGQLIKEGAFSLLKGLVGRRRIEVSFNTTIDDGCIRGVRGLAVKLSALSGCDADVDADGRLTIWYDSVTNINDVLGLLASCGYILTGVSIKDASLEDVFLSLVE